MQEFGVQQKPRLIPGLSRIITCGSFVVAVFIVAGCTGSNPRFGSTGQPRATTTPSSNATSPTLSKEAVEEKKEDDVPVDASVKESIVSGARDFRREKNPALSNLDQAKMMREISKFMGVPYEYGGNTGEGLDCSAYTQTVFKNSLKKELPRTSREQSQVGSTVGFSDLMFGDLIFFNTTGDPASHVGIYLGDDLFAHASVTFGVTISSLQSSYYKNRFEIAKRIIE